MTRVKGQVEIDLESNEISSLPDVDSDPKGGAKEEPTKSDILDYVAQKLCLKQGLMCERFNW